LFLKEDVEMAALKFIEIYPKLLKYAVSLTKQEMTGEDLAMEVITKILEADNLPLDVNIEAYAMRSVKNLFLNNLKRDAREVSEQNESGESTYDQTTDPLSGSFVNAGELERVLLGLEVKCREILTLFAVGNSYKEIAGVLEIQAGTVMSRMARCREHLNPIMDQSEYV